MRTSRARVCFRFGAFLAAGLFARSSAGAVTLPAGFQETIVFSGLTNPTAVRFASDGRVFVAEKSGLVKVFDNLSDTSPTVFADLRTNVHNFWDRGLLGLALDRTSRRTPTSTSSTRTMLRSAEQLPRGELSVALPTDARTRRARPEAAAW